MDKMNIVSAFLESGYQISPNAVDLVASHSSANSLIQYIIENIDESVFVIGLEHIDVASFEADRTVTVPEAISDKIADADKTGMVVDGMPDTLTLDVPDLDKVHDTPSATSSPNPVDILSDITDRSTCIGEYMEFVQYFRNRYTRLSEMLRGRLHARPMESLRDNRRRGGVGEGDRSGVSIIGMVSDLRTTTNGHRMIELEDSTGSFPALVRLVDKDLYDTAAHLVLDEVVGITGNLTNDGSLLIAKSIMFPDVPNIGPQRPGTTGKAVFTSDVHIGSSTFLEDEWLSFLDFLRGDTDNEELRSISKDIRYLVVAGDLVDGIGIFPGQENELDIPDVYQQYKKAAEYFRDIPEHITVVIGPGNHDAVRQAEPQPCFPERIRSMYPDRIVFVGNPAMVSLDGVNVLMYHGRSIDDLVASIPGVSYEEPSKAMVEMVKCRHLSPIYGSRVSIAPEKNDHFVIDPIPHILHCGHVHTVGVQSYKNVLLINSGTWQSQTEFQKRVNVVPTPAQVPVVDLSNFKTSLLTF
ncbi:MAG: DNA-directed DNA polymerase II small subunit [Methanosarcinaceae archaeon]|nr:DNA-directed DNA polymerase II small subunit [Methanosarcinaceae archaeon]